jgi:ADP-ribose pyrophosphatase YjhB (NUDIX family)
MESVTVGVGVVVKRAGRIALGLRKGVNPTWSLPGGKIEPFEHILGCAVRELREETGLIVDGTVSVFCVANIRIESDRLHTVTFGVVVDHCGGELTLSEPDKFIRWSWFDPEELPVNLFWPTHVILHQWNKMLQPLAADVSLLHIPLCDE